MTKPKLCINCAHIQQVLNFTGQRVYMCGYGAKDNLVLGGKKTGTHLCETARQEGWFCGPEASKFQKGLYVLLRE